MPFASDISGRVRKATRLTLNEMGRDWVKLLRWTVNEPYPPPSEPGDHPHRRSKTLQRSFKYKVAPKATSVEDLNVFIDEAVFEKYAPNGYNYSLDLEYGRASTNLEPRPYWRPVRKQLSPKLQTWFERLFAKHMGELTDAAGQFDSSDAAADFPAQS